VLSTSAHARRRVGAGLAAIVAIGGLTYLLVIGRSHAAPVPGAKVYVLSRCVPFGRLVSVSGNGFGARERLTVYAPTNGTPPLSTYYIRPVTATADSSGGFRARLRTPKSPRSERAYQVRLLAATGASGVRADTAVLIATLRVCRFLHPAG